MTSRLQGREDFSKQYRRRYEKKKTGRPASGRDFCPGLAHHAGRADADRGAVYRYRHGGLPGHPGHRRGGGHRHRILAGGQHRFRHRRGLSGLHLSGLWGRGGGKGQTGLRPVRHGRAGGGHRVNGPDHRTQRFHCQMDAGGPGDPGGGQYVFPHPLRPHAVPRHEHPFRYGAAGGGGYPDPHAGGHPGQCHQCFSELPADLPQQKGSVLRRFLLCLGGGFPPGALGLPRIFRC